MDAAKEISGIPRADHTHLVARVVQKSGHALMRFIRARVATEADAEDVLQDVWQQFVATLEDGPIEQLGAWLYTVARHRIIDRYRKRRMASVEALVPSPDVGEESLDLANLLPADDSEESASWRTMFWIDLHAALAELPEPQRQVFIWHELEGLSFAEMADRTGENINTLLSRKRYAVQYLRQRLVAWHENLNG